MGKSILNGKRILAVDDEPDVLTVLADQIADTCPNCTFETATSYQEAVEKLGAVNYDIVVLDIMGVQGFDLLEFAVKKSLKVAMLTAHALTPEALKRSHDMGARAFLPKEKLPEIVSFLEDVLEYEFKPGWKRLLERLYDTFNHLDDFKDDWEEKAGVKGRAFV